MNVKTVKKPKRRIDIGYVSRFKMQAYGYDNLYPQNLARITEASGTAMLCLNRYARFIEGYGFDSDILAALAMNQQGDTADDLLRNVSGDLARFGGFALHVNYNVLGQVSSVSHVPFENCRLEETDDKGNVAHVLLHPDWEQKKTRNGKRLMVNEKTIERINTFNPDPDIVLEQIENAGGIDSYKGQILWQSLDGQFIYPTASYDSAITEISTDEGLGNVKMRNVRNNFLVSCMLVTKKGVPKFNEKGEEVESGQMISDEDLLQFQGDENTAKILAVEVENEEDEPKVVAFPTKNFEQGVQRNRQQRYRAHIRSVPPRTLLLHPYGQARIQRTSYAGRLRILCRRSDDRAAIHRSSLQEDFQELARSSHSEPRPKAAAVEVYQQRGGRE